MGRFFAFVFVFVFVVVLTSNDDEPARSEGGGRGGGRRGKISWSRACLFSSRLVIRLLLRLHTSSIGNWLLLPMMILLLIWSTMVRFAGLEASSDSPLGLKPKRASCGSPPWPLNVGDP